MGDGKSPSGGQARRRNAADLKLARDITAGSETAWHEFIQRYSGLIYSVVRRYLFDDDEIRSVYVDVLERLYRGRLATFEGRSALSTWLVLVARTTALDYLRKRFGRREMPAALRNLSTRDQEIFRRYYVEGMSFAAVRHRAAAEGRPLSAGALASILQRLEERLDQRVLSRLAYNLHASSQGAASGRLLEFLDQHRLELETAGQTRTPEAELVEKEARRQARRVHDLLAKLPEEERRILTLRFDHGWTAAHIAEELGLEGQRRAYTLIERGLRLLRNLLKTEG